MYRCQVFSQIVELTDSAPRHFLRGCSQISKTKPAVKSRITFVSHYLGSNGLKTLYQRMPIAVQTLLELSLLSSVICLWPRGILHNGSTLKSVSGLQVGACVSSPSIFRNYRVDTTLFKRVLSDTRCPLFNLVLGLLHIIWSSIGLKRYTNACQSRLKLHLKYIQNMVWLIKQ